MGGDELYETTRKWWVVGPQRREFGSESAPEWAMAVFRGVVQAVYRIDGWEKPTKAENRGGPGTGSSLHIPGRPVAKPPYGRSLGPGRGHHPVRRLQVEARPESSPSG